MSNSRGAQLRSYLELIRPPALFTAAADSLTGWAWAGAVIVSPDHLSAWYVPVLLILISGSVYAAGMCTNDLFDLEEDRRDRPQRPLPSARIPVASAWALALTLQASALGVALIMSWALYQQLITPLFWFVLATVSATYLYNGALKNTFIAPLIMGACRWGNFWIGGAAYLTINADIAMTESLVATSIEAPLFGGLVISLGTLVYVTTLTALSRFEVQTTPNAYSSGARWAALILCISAAFPLIGIGLGILEWGALSAICVSLWIAKRTWPPLCGVDTSATQVQRGVSAGIRGVALVNVALCLGLEGWWTAGLIVIMAWSAGHVGRWFYAT